MVWRPSAKLLMLFNTACPLTTAMVPSVLPVPLSTNATVPVLIGVPGLAVFVTVASKDTADPVVEGFGVAVNDVVVAVPVVRVKLTHQLLIVCIAPPENWPISCSN